MDEGAFHTGRATSIKGRTQRRDHLVTDAALAGNLAVAPLRPLFIAQQGQDGAALVVIVNVA